MVVNFLAIAPLNAQQKLDGQHSSALLPKQLQAQNFLAQAASSPDYRNLLLQNGLQPVTCANKASQVVVTIDTSKEYCANPTPLYPAGRYQLKPVSLTVEPIEANTPINYTELPNDSLKPIRAEINKIYQQELGREADRDGLATYLNHYQGGWSFERIRNEIASSVEARRYRSRGLK